MSGRSGKPRRQPKKGCQEGLRMANGAEPTEVPAVRYDAARGRSRSVCNRSAFQTYLRDPARYAPAENPPAAILSRFVEPGRMYTFQVTLCNRLEECGREIVQVSVAQEADGNLNLNASATAFVVTPSVALQGPTLHTVPARLAHTFVSSAGFCAGGDPHTVPWFWSVLQLASTSSSSNSTVPSSEAEDAVLLVASTGVPPCLLIYRKKKHLTICVQNIQSKLNQFCKCKTIQ